MTTLDKDGLVVPLIIYDTLGDLVTGLVINEKGYFKSLEQRQLWYLDGLTGRLIPYDQIESFVSLEIRGIDSANTKSGFQKGTWIQAVVKPQNLSPKAQLTPQNSEMVQESRVQQQPEPQLEPQIIPDIGQKPPHSEFNSEFNSEQVFFHLEQLIRSRKQTMPEGSYTTHLFTKGEDKIRKKAGEEAIELLLAKTDQELVSESADFLYHLLVLFVEKSIPFQTIIDELASRT
jgi:phosphoribosyl-ATP pyrophosphohydrolase/phosphoribosyl-AMP cyclohydrolase